MGLNNQTIVKEHLRVTANGKAPRHFLIPAGSEDPAKPTELVTENELNNFRSYFAAASILNTALSNYTGFNPETAKIAGGVTLTDMVPHTNVDIVNNVGDNQISNVVLSTIEFGITYHSQVSNPENKIAKLEVLLNDVSQGEYNYNAHWNNGEVNGQQSAYPVDLISTINLLIESAGINTNITDLQKSKVRISLPMTEFPNGENKVQFSITAIDKNGDDKTAELTLVRYFFKESLDKPNVSGRFDLTEDATSNKVVRSGINMLSRGGRVFFTSNGFIDDIFNQTYQDNIILISSPITGDQELTITDVVYTGGGNPSSPDKNAQISFTNHTANLPNDAGVNSSVAVSMTVRTPRGNSVETVNKFVVMETHDLLANSGLAGSSESLETFQTEVRRYPTTQNAADNNESFRNLSITAIDSSTYTYQNHDLLWIGSQCIYGKLNFNNAIPASTIDRSALTGMAYFVRGFQVPNASNLRLTFNMAEDFTGMAIQLLFSDNSNNANSSCWVSCLDTYVIANGNIPRSFIPDPTTFGIATNINNTNKTIDVTLTDIVTDTSDVLFLRIGYPDTNQKTINSLQVEAI